MPEPPARRSAALFALGLALLAPARAQTPPASGLQHTFAPFVDATAWPLPDLDALSAASGARGFVLGFLVNDGQTAARPCTPKWGGFDPYYATAAQAAAGGGEVHLLAEVDQLRAAGGRVMVSFGGAANVPLAATCPSAQALADAYASVVDTYGVHDLDFDIEGTWVADAASRARRVAGLVLLQQMRPAVRVWFTLPVLPTGLDANGVSTLNEAVAGGVDLAGVNVMAMDYGGAAAPDPSRLGEYAIGAMTGLHGQIRTAYASAGRPLTDGAAWSMVGVTPMIGVNDVPAEVFTLGHAAEVMAFAVEHRIGLVSMWSVNRDLPCPGGPSPWPQTTCSSVAQDPYAFSALFRQMDASTATAGGPVRSAGAELLAPHPNPTHGAAAVAFVLAAPAGVRLGLYDALGRRVALLADGVRAAGRHEVALGVLGRLPAGVYVLRLDGAGVPLSRRVVVH